MPERAEITVEEYVDTEGKTTYTVKLQREDWELNVRIPAGEHHALSKVNGASWKKRESLRIGEIVDAPAWWCGDDSGVTIMVGNDDECWDVAFVVHADTPNAILTEIAKLAATR